MVTSEDPCPKCGKHDYWHSGTHLNKGGKTVTKISFCGSCGSYFKQIKHLVRIDAKNKIIKKVKK
jgi:hypothetical protein